MEITHLNEVDSSSLEKLLSGIPFYKQLQQTDEQQFLKVVSISRFVRLQPGEVIMRTGSQGSWIYYLIKGQLEVSLGDNEPAVNQIMPGELFGDLALFSGQNRSATVKAQRQGYGAKVIATDFSAFGELDDFDVFSLTTKLKFYQSINHSVRWKLELLRMNDRTHPLVQEMFKLALFKGEKGGLDELKYLHQQAISLCTLLLRWRQQDQIDD